MLKEQAGNLQIRMMYWIFCTYFGSEIIGTNKIGVK